MKISKVILVLLKALVEILLMSLKDLEQSGNVDADGIPLDADYDRQRFLLASIRDTIKSYDDENENN